MRPWQRRDLAALALGLLAVLGSPGAGLAAEPSSSAVPTRERPARIGLLLYGSLKLFPPGTHPLFVGLRDVGLIGGKNATIVVREANGHTDRMPQLATELVAAQPDIIVTAGPQPIQAVKAATATIPIVMAVVSDPVTYGFVRSLAHPGGNLTGLSMVNTELSSK